MYAESPYHHIMLRHYIGITPSYKYRPGSDQPNNNIIIIFLNAPDKNEQYMYFTRIYLLVSSAKICTCDNYCMHNYMY